MKYFQWCLAINIRQIWVLLVFVLQGVAVNVYAAKVDFMAVERVIVNQNIKEIQPYSINLLSNKRLFDVSVSRLTLLGSDLVHINKINIDGTVYYRLVVGNFRTRKSALAQLSHYKKTFKGAWISIRSKAERQVLSSFIVKPVVKPKRKLAVKNTLKANSKRLRKKIKKTSHTTATRIFEKMKQYLLDQNYPRLIASANKVIETGTHEQKQQAMEWLGIARERQGKFAQAIAVYQEFLYIYPKSPLANKISSRLESLKTMRLEPKARQAKRKRLKRNDNWSVFGSASQYYRDDTIQQGTEATDNVHSSLLSDVNVFARKRTDKEVIVVRFDGGLVNDFLDNRNEVRISRALVRYNDKVKEYKVTGGRQSRTAKGASGRFDGIVYTDLSKQNYTYSVYSGFPVASSADGFQSEHFFIGGSVNFEPYPNLVTDVYLISQYNSSLTDRQAVGSELQYITDKGFLFGIIDYDFFYAELNNVTAIGNYRYDPQWTFNMTIDYRNAPLLTTVNALQGQQTDSLDELAKTYTDSQIYSLARDRTSKSQNMYFGANYIIDEARQFTMSLSIANTQATVSSASVLATPASESVYLSGDYSVQNFFAISDFSTIGLRLSYSNTSETLSIRTRTRFNDARGIRYAPRLTLDYRLNTDSGLSQTIIKPSLKAHYQYNKKFAFEANLAFEFSDFNLPEQDKQTASSIYVGYIYQF